MDVIYEYNDGTQSAPVPVEWANELDRVCPEGHVVGDDGWPVCPPTATAATETPVATNPLTSQLTSNPLAGGSGGHLPPWAFPSLVAGLVLVIVAHSTIRYRNKSKEKPHEPTAGSN